MNNVKIEDLQALQDEIDERAKAESSRFRSDFIVAGSTYIDGFSDVAANKIDADLVCKGELPICQSPRDVLGVCAAKDALAEKFRSDNVFCTGLGINCSDCNVSFTQKDLNIELNETGVTVISINPAMVSPIARCAAIASGSAFYISVPEQDEYFLSYFSWVFDNPIPLASPEAVCDLLHQLNKLEIPTTKVFLTLCSDDGSDFTLFAPDYKRWFDEVYACFG